MRLQISKSTNAKSYYVIKTIYNPTTKKNTSKIVEKLGTEAHIKETYHVSDADKWAKDYVEQLNVLEKEGKIPDVLVKYSPQKQISSNNQVSFNCGYLFLQDLYHKLSLDKMCKDISKKYSFTYDLNSILSRLVYSRILFPASKLSTFELSKKFIEPPNFDCHQIYRALSVIAKESDFIQQELYANSLKYTKRNTGVIYYDCTNYFFEIEEPDVDGDRQYGKSKENRPNPIVQMGLFMDSDGIPLSFSITPGNTNEQITLKPLEEKLISDFNMSKFVVCTDAGLASTANRKFNDKADRAFITTQSIKKLKESLRTWSLSTDGWKLPGNDHEYNIENLNEDNDFNKIYYKERWINENNLEQRIIVTYSMKYANYQKKIRDNQIERAKKAIAVGKSKLKKKNANDYRRFVTEIAATADGEVADKKVYSLNEEVAQTEALYDGYYAVCTNLEDSPESIIKINSKRWEIEECFRIMKSEFEARPVYLQRKDRITAHFMICFLALTIYRFLEHKLEEKYTCPKIIQTLQDMTMYKASQDGYIPTYTRTSLTDDLHEKFGFRTDYEITTEKNMKKILKGTQKR